MEAALPGTEFSIDAFFFLSDAVVEASLGEMLFSSEQVEKSYSVFGKLNL